MKWPLQTDGIFIWSKANDIFHQKLGYLISLNWSDPL
jgi:hypothetical protein